MQAQIGGKYFQLQCLQPNQNTSLIFFLPTSLYKKQTDAMMLFSSFYSFKNLTYSTCSNDRKTCPDRICDSLEALKKFSICPQDCIPRNNIDLSIMFKNLKDRGLGDLKSPNDHICSCSGRKCSCVHKNDTHSMEEVDEKANKPLDDHNALTWILPLSFGVLLIVVATLLYGKRR